VHVHEQPLLVLGSFRRRDLEQIVANDPRELNPAECHAERGGQRQAGRGGFGEVWLGVNRATGGLKAVRIIPLASGGHSTDPAGREIVSLSQLERQRIGHHPRLLDIQHVGRTDEVLFYLMDPADDVSGRPATNDPGYRPATLALKLEQGPLPADECLRCARALDAGTIDFATTREVVARWP
jgi:hypothetical protein